MIRQVSAAVAVLLYFLEAHAQNCKEPVVAQRLLSNDVKYASPFYVTALPKNPNTEQMDNVCYSYFDNGDNFFHIISITYKNGTNTFYTYTKADLSNRMGLAVGSAVLDSQCVFHDYTLTPICNSSVFVLYRCFIEGSCSSNIDIGITPGVDVRLALAANPIVSKECRAELEANLQDTSFLAGGNYVILPQKLAPQCVTRYNNTNSIGYDRAVGSKQVTENELEERFGGEYQGVISTNTVTQPSKTVIPTVPSVKTTSQKRPIYNVPSNTKISYNPYGSTVNPTGARPGVTVAPSWSANNGQWTQGNGQTVRYGTQTHQHVWQSQPSVQTRTTVGENPNVIYHVHSWNTPPPGCCRCN